MPFAPLYVFRQNPPPQTTTSHLDPVTAPDHSDTTGQESFTLEFYSPPIPARHPTSTQSLPPSHNEKPSLYTPPPHDHLSKDRTIRLQPGGTISIPALTYHWFENAPDSRETLKFGYWYTAEYTALEQRFYSQYDRSHRGLQAGGAEGVGCAALCSFVAELDCCWGC